jgi:hypothetical protein
MRRRFGRRRGGRDRDSGDTPLDPGTWLARIAESGIAGAADFAALTLEGVAPGSVVLGASGSGDVLLGFSPRDAGDALFGALALAQSRAAESGFTGTAIALAPAWSDAARRRLGLLRALPYGVRALAASQLAEDPGAVEPASVEREPAVAPEQIIASLERPDDRALFARSVAALQGLAAKHGGSVRGVGRRVELVLFARRAACVDAGDGALRLLVDAPDRAVLELSADALATLMDRLEGSLRKQLGDRKIRASEEGQRATLLRILERAAGLRRSVPWPFTGQEPSRLDLAGVGPAGEAVVAATRDRLSLAGLGEILDAALDAAPQLPAWLPGGPVPLRGGPPRLVLAATHFETAALHVLAALSLATETWDVRPRRSGELSLERREVQLPPPVRAELRAPAAPRPTPERFEPRPAPAAPERETQRPAERERFPRFESFEDFEPDEGPDRERQAPREPAAPRSDRAPAREEEAPPAVEGASRFEEVSLFDLEEETPSPGGAGAQGAPGRRRRRGGRRRGRRGRSNGSAPYPGDASPAREPAPSSARDREREPREGFGPRQERARPEPRPSEVEDEEVVDDDAITGLAEGPELEEAVEPAEPSYEEEEGEERDEGDEGERRERELRRRARLAKTVDRIEVSEAPRPPRRRAAFVAHADRASVLTAVVLARDVRLVEGFWVYPQEDLMTFFRSIATDLREDTPIFLVGFAASPPARDTLQAAALYRGRLHWFDHHPWPPEDLVALREAIGADCVHVEPGGDGSLAQVIAECTRRSRFSDKLVDLVTGRFSQHDYERWGRHWWHRAGEIAAKRGERRSELEPLLIGRPSELSRHASSLPPPPLPPEVSFVSERDFRLVHFGGYTLVVIEVPAELDLHLAARIARERYEAQLSLAFRPGGELLVLGGDESRVKRGLDLAGMAEHLASKHEWIHALPDEDHVARMLVRNLSADPSRLDEVIAEIAMGRSIVEG